jgi:hypothetical protein
VAQLPQVVANHRAGSAEALSPWFLARTHPPTHARTHATLAPLLSRSRHATPALSSLPPSRQAEWLLGDTCNLLGCLLTGNQLPTQTFTACYYLGMDVVMVSQFAFYARRKSAAERQQQRRSSGAEAGVGGEEALRAAAAPLLAPPQRRAKPSTSSAASAALLPALLLCAALAAAHPQPQPLPHTPSLHTRGGPAPRPGPPSLCGASPRPPWATALGDTLGWASAAAYAASRVSQLRRNASRGADGASGLSPAMFALAIAGNGLYAASVLLRLSGTFADVARAAPWLAGSLGVLALDGVIVRQARAAEARGAAAEAAADGDDGDDGGAEEGRGYAPPAAVGVGVGGS